MYLYVLKTHELSEYADYDELIKFSIIERLFIGFSINRLICRELFSFIYYLKNNQIPFVLYDCGYLHMSEGFNSKGDYKKLNQRFIGLTNWFSKQLDLYQSHRLYHLI